MKPKGKIELRQQKLRGVGIVGLAMVAAACNNQAAERAAEVQPESRATATEPIQLERFSVGGRQFAVPSAHVHSMNREPHGFVRIKHPEARFELVYDSRLEGAWDEQGIYRIFSVNDGGAPAVEYHQKAGTLVVCRRAPSPRGGCGTKLRYGDGDWTVLFPYALLEEADEMLPRAFAVLNEYES